MNTEMQKRALVARDAHLALLDLKGFVGASDPSWTTPQQRFRPMDQAKTKDISAVQPATVELGHEGTFPILDGAVDSDLGA